MNARGQVFTLDMLFALTLVVLVVSYSGLALEQARKQAESYSTRYSIERVANDAADALVKTLGSPYGWNLENLETPGLAENVLENYMKPALNTIDVSKFGLLRYLCASENWDEPANETARRAMENFFGGYNFEIRVLDENGDEVWDIWPGWEPRETSGSENAIEVVVVRRSVTMRYGDVRNELKELRHIVGGPGGPTEYYLDFWVYPGELDTFDWYVVLEPSESNQPQTDIWVNSTSGTRFHFPTETIFPMRYHGEDGEVENALTDEENNGHPNNYLYIEVAGNPQAWVNVYVVAVPRCSPLEVVLLAIERMFSTLEVKVWR